MNGFKTIALRLAAAAITVMVSARFLPAETVAAARHAASAPAAAFPEALRAWGWQTLGLCGQIFAIIMPLMVVIENLKAFRMIPHLLRVCHPVLRLMGLDRRVGMLWLTAGMFGIAYGAAVIVEETRENRFDPDDLARLHVSIGINHAMIEDPCLFLPLGIGVFWLWIPRLVTAILAVRLLALWQRWHRPHAAPSPSREEPPASHEDLRSEA